jgi:HSP20 family molecular chaperone IbpA
MKQPRVESFIEGDKLIVRAELPRIDPKNIEVTAVGNMLTIRASKEERHEDKERDFLRQEIAYGKIERSIPLPPGTTGEGGNSGFVSQWDSGGRGADSKGTRESKGAGFR